MTLNNNILSWIEKAEGDFETVNDLVAKKRKRQRYIIAFHAQQCIEKYLKALLVNFEIEFPRHHDLEELLVLLLQKDSLLGPIRNDLKMLTPFAVEFRYPGEDILQSEVTAAVKIAGRLRKILRQRLGLKA